ncbi:MAG: T9SS type A sorting domain-containing protein [Ignavibacteriae bacterium]|nr:T9SS type A sorting domain-containing protein [Ignavibacteriota bacterium]
MYLSTNNGTSWTTVNNGLTNQYVNALAVSGTNIFAGTWGGGLFLSTNNGSNWTAVNNGLTGRVNALAVSGTNIFAGTVNVGVFLSTNNGTSWVQKNQGLNAIPPVWSLLVANGYVYAGTWDQSVWRRSLTEIIVIKNISTEIPSAYSLSQNYPNPFNPTTNIKFNVAKLSDVKIVVYDVMGREVQTLVNESLKPGTYETSFDGGMLNSGVYFYRLITEGFTETKRMILIK